MHGQPSDLRQKPWRFRHLISGTKLSLVCLLFSVAVAADSSAADPASVEFFENRIRPVLVEHCYSCHSEPARQAGDFQAGLAVDSQSALLRGGDSGPAVTPGSAEQSLLLAAMRYEDYEMPPAGRLDDSILEDFRLWIEAGATDPRTEVNADHSSKMIDLEAGRQHWAYQPLPLKIHPPQPTELSAATPIDAFIEAAWPQHPPATEDGSANLVIAAPLAERHTLIRRLYFDLTGLPPTPAELRASLTDESPQAYENLVDRLLASPDFGEHWGRHWLDIARYAESVTLRGLVQHQAWRYRDYVIAAMNQDLPYDRFVLEQVAGDLLPADSIAQQQIQCIATGFLTLGNHNLEDQDKEKLNMDAVDEQLNVIGSAILAQTIGCARCHDHKFDPIPTRDYYALAGILRNVQSFEHSNVSNWVEKPLPLSPSAQQQITVYQQQMGELRKQIAAAEKQLKGSTAGQKSVPVKSLPGIVIDNEQAELVGQWTRSDHTPRFVANGYLHDDNQGQGKKTATFSTLLPAAGRYRVLVSYSAGGNRSRQVVVTVQDAQDTHIVKINQQRAPSSDGLFEDLGEYTFTTSAAAQVTIANVAATGHVIVDAVQFLPLDATNVTADLIVKEDPREAEAQQALQAELQQWKQELKELEQRAPSQPKYMGVREREEVKDLAIQIRGNVHRAGELAPRGVLSVAVGDCQLSMPANASGREELGRWLADESNPLTARVMANRVWGWLCGEWLVRSPDNFGTTGTPPTHPELLDYLARQLIDQGWSIKSLIREIVLSETYRRDSQATSEILAVDPT